MYFAGLSSAPADESPPDPATSVVLGFVVVTAPAQSGMLDVPDRRPLVLTLEEARVWLDPETTLEEALHLANNAGKSSDDFHWHTETPEMNCTGTDRPDFNAPIDPANPDATPAVRHGAATGRGKRRVTGAAAACRAAHP